MASASSFWLLRRNIRASFRGTCISYTVAFLVSRTTEDEPWDPSHWRKGISIMLERALRNWCPEPRDPSAGREETLDHSIVGVGAWKWTYDQRKRLFGGSQMNRAWTCEGVFPRCSLQISLSCHLWFPVFFSQTVWKEKGTERGNTKRKPWGRRCQGKIKTLKEGERIGKERQVQGSCTCWDRSWDFPGSPVAKPLALLMQGTWVQSLLRERDLTCHN